MAERNATTDGIKGISEGMKGGLKHAIGKILRHRGWVESGRNQRHHARHIRRTAKAEFDGDVDGVSAE